MNIFKVIKNKNGLSIVEILVAASIFFVLFTAVAATYALGINLQYRSELSTSAELIGQFLLEYFTSFNPLFIVSEDSYKYLFNLPYPEGAYHYLNQTYPGVYKSWNNLTEEDKYEIYEEAIARESFFLYRYFRSEWAPDEPHFPYIFMIDGFDELPPDTNLTYLNNIFPQSIKFKGQTGDYQIEINSFPPFFIAHSPDLRYRLIVGESTYLTYLLNPSEDMPDLPDEKYRYFEVTVEVEWKVKGRSESNKYEIKTVVPY